MEINHNALSIYIDVTGLISQGDPEAVNHMRQFLGNSLETVKERIMGDSLPQLADQGYTPVSYLTDRSINDSIPECSLFIQTSTPEVVGPINHIQQETWQIICQKMDDILPERSRVNTPSSGYFHDSMNRIWLQQCLTSMYDMPPSLKEAFTHHVTESYRQVLGVETLTVRAESSIMNPVQLFR